MTQHFHKQLPLWHQIILVLLIASACVVTGNYFVIAVLATYRLAYDIAKMDGPFEIYVRFRWWIEAKFGADHWIEQGVNCPICTSFWVSLPIALAALMGENAFPVLLWPLYWIGCAGGALTIIRATSK